MIAHLTELGKHAPSEEPQITAQRAHSAGCSWLSPEDAKARNTAFRFPQINKTAAKPLLTHAKYLAGSIERCEHDQRTVTGMGGPKPSGTRRSVRLHLLSWPEKSERAEELEQSQQHRCERQGPHLDSCSGSLPPARALLWERCF